MTTNRERFLGICRFERPGDLYIRDTFWPGTLKKWVEQGAPEEMVAPRSAYGTRFLWDYFQIPFWHQVRVQPPPPPRRGFFANDEVLLWQTVPVAPASEPTITSEDEHTVTFVNGVGQTMRLLKDDPTRMPMYLDWPVKDRASWNEYKTRLDPNTPGRYAADWDAYVKRTNKVGEETPISLHLSGFFGPLREMVGSERILYMFYDDPNLIEDMMEQVLYLVTENIKRVTKDIRVDLGYFWEDIAYNAGPLISPAMVRKFMMPRYKKITDLLHSNGVDIIFLDSDGKIDELIPLWLEVGINFLWPFEVASGMDAVALRKKYGKDLIMSGNIDKRALVKGKEAIREEVMSKVPFLLEQGGYFPGTDHMVPPEVTFENYCYHINLMREVAGLEKLSFQ